MVSSGSTNPHRHTEANSKLLQDFLTMGLNYQAPLTRKTEVVSNENFRRHYKSCGFSDEAAVVLMRSFCETTKQVYRPVQKCWFGFASQQHFNPSDATVTQLANFFVSEFTWKGRYNYHRAVRARSAIAPLFESRQDNVMTHPLLTRLFKGFFNIKPVMRKTLETWDPDIVLNKIVLWKPPKKLSLMGLAAKSAFLILLATGCRKSELMGNGYKSHVNLFRSTRIWSSVFNQNLF